MKVGNRSATVVAHREATEFGQGGVSGNRNKTALNHMFARSPLPLDVAAEPEHHSEEDVEHYGKAALSGLVIEASEETSGLSEADLGILNIDADGISSDASAYYGKFDGVDFDPNYGSAPNMHSVTNPTELDGTAYSTIAVGTTDDGGVVAYIPNPTSPGEVENDTNMNPSTINALSEASEIPFKKFSQYGSARTRGSVRDDDNGPSNPSEESEAIAKQDFKSLTLGSAE